MTGKQTYAFGWVSALLMIAGLVFCFSSPSLGTMKAMGWLQNEEGGMTDTSLYTAVAESNMAMFVMLGGILFALGLLLAMATYFLNLFFGIPAEGDEKDSEWKPL